jgi:myosin heavy subunit
MNESLSEYRVEEKVSQIKQALQKLGAAFKATEYSQDDTAKMSGSYNESYPQSWGRRSADTDKFLGSESMSSPKFQIPGSARSSNHIEHAKEWPKPTLEGDPRPMLDPTSSIIYKKSLDFTDGRTEGRVEGWELSLLLEGERERIGKLESQLNYKESLLEESLKLQQELYCRLEESRREQTKLEEKYEAGYSSLEAQVRTLEAKNNRLEQENADLKAELHQHDKERSQVKELKINIEELQSRLHRQRRASTDDALRERLAERSEELELLRTEVQRLEQEVQRGQAIEGKLQQELLEAQKERNRLGRELDGARAGADEESAGYRRPFDDTASKGDRYQVGLLRNEVDELRGENEALREKLNGAWKELKGTEKKHEGHRGRHRKAMQGGKTRRKTSSRSRSTTPAKKQLDDLLAECDVQTCSEAVQTVKELKAKVGRVSQQAKFVERVVELVKNTTSSAKPPSLKSLYKWLVRVVDDYYLLKNSQEHRTATSDVVSKLLHLTALEQVADLPRYVSQLQSERHSMRQQISQVKSVLG